LPDPPEPAPPYITNTTYPSHIPQLLTSDLATRDSETQPTTDSEDTPGSFSLVGYTEPTQSEIQLDTMQLDPTPTTSLPFESIPIHTYQGNTLIQPTTLRFDLPSSSRAITSLELDPTWSKGIGLELSPLKTRSACKNTTVGSSTSVTTTSVPTQGVLRAVKSLARGKT
jgi:hypothetical protein